MAKYRVKITTIKHNHTEYEPGSEIELKAAEARRLKAYLEPLKGKPAPNDEGDKSSGNEEGKEGNQE